MTTFFLSVTKGSGGPVGPASNVAVSEGTSTVAAAAINVELNTTIAPNLSYGDAINMLQSCINYVQSDRRAPAANRVLNLSVP